MVLHCCSSRTGGSQVSLDSLDQMSQDCLTELSFLLLTKSLVVGKFHFDLVVVCAAEELVLPLQAGLAHCFAAFAVADTGGAVRPALPLVEGDDSDHIVVGQSDTD